ncbi:MAG: TonB-dependent receptor [Gammaproteobacteria bacterium]
MSGSLVWFLSVILLTVTTERVFAHEEEEITELETLTVTGRADDLSGIAESSNQGRVGQAQLRTRPILRSGELLEIVPGAVVTQHSGTGKANQYFLRGFNLDHGTDFNARIDSVPLNLPSHGHGQGYLDINPIIPELVNYIDYGKGPYYADVGDFSSAGYAHYHLYDELDKGLLRIGVGEDDFYRGVVADSMPLAQGTFLYGMEAQNYDGPWDLDEDALRLNLLLKYTGGTVTQGYRFTGMSYYGDWDSTDQVPQRAVDQGLISRLGQIDPTLGGRAQRHGLSMDWWSNRDKSAIRLNAFAFYSRLDLWSNFTYFLEDPIDGDQFKQIDRRYTYGGTSEYDWHIDGIGQHSFNTLGLQLRHDYIPKVGLFQTQERNELRTVREDEVQETSVGLYLKNETQWLRWFRTVLGLRGDYFRFDVDSETIAQNSGDEGDAQFSPKLSLVFGPWYETELYLNLGRGFHSNDARGTTIRIDPKTGDAVEPVEPLVESQGAEGGLRTSYVPGLQSTLGLWYLELDSELVFVGDAGTTEASGESRRYGVEWANFYQVTDWLTLDLDVAFTKAEFTDVADDEIPNSVGRVISAGGAVDFPNGIFGALRLRHFGDVPLIEDDSVEAGSTTVVNLQGGYRLLEDLSLQLDVFNLFDSEDSDIAYFFDSRLAGEPAEGVSDLHLHPVEPRAVRVTLNYRF